MLLTFYHGGKYQLAGEGRQLSWAKFTDYLATLADKFPIVSVENGMQEGDGDGWKPLTHGLGKRVRLDCDGLFAANTHILRECIEKGIASSILIKINQIGAPTETFAAIAMANRTYHTALL